MFTYYEGETINSRFFELPCSCHQVSTVADYCKILWNFFKNEPFDLNNRKIGLLTFVS